MARGLRLLSTDYTADLHILFRRAVLGWLIADGDMHLKNLAMLKMAEAGAKTFTTVRFAPPRTDDVPEGASSFEVNRSRVGAALVNVGR